MPERWWIQVCPECNGLVYEQRSTHNETCPNRLGRMFVPRDVEVVPAGDAWERVGEEIGEAKR